MLNCPHLVLGHYLILLDNPNVDLCSAMRYYIVLSSADSVWTQSHDLVQTSVDSVDHGLI